MSQPAPTEPTGRMVRSAYNFVTEALFVAKQLFDRSGENPDDADSHISAKELLEGVRVLGTRHYGMLAPQVFRSWGVHSTSDFGRLVFDMIDRGEMRKTDQDQLIDFDDVYSFDQVFRDSYRVDVSAAFH